MVNMMMSKEEAKEYTSPDPAEAPAYPYGLEICLNDDSLQKLGMNDAPPAVGATVMVMAKCVVTSCGMNQTQGGEMESRCTLQITDMEMSAQGGNLAKRMYPDMNE